RHGDLQADPGGAEDLRVAQELAVPARREAAPDGDEPARVEGIDDERQDRRVEEHEADHGDDGGEADPAHQRPASSRSPRVRMNMIGTTTATSMAMATAAATGQSRLAKNSFQRTRPIISVSGPPRSSGMTNSPIAGMKTSMKPATMPGSVSGSVTRRNVTEARAPRSAEASSRLSSSFTIL